MPNHLDRARDYATRLAGIYGEALVSVGLYGSAARGEYREGASDLNLLVILREVTPEGLRRGSAAAREWVEGGNPPPLIFSEREWRGSADVFPIEYSDIADAHLVLHGSDPFQAVEVGWEHLRLMCEHEMKAKKLALREHYLLAADEPERLGALLLHSVGTFVAVFRAALRLSGADAPREHAAVVDAVAERAGFDPAPLRRALEARAGGDALSPAADDPLVTGYLHAVQAASDWLDGLTRTAPAGTSS
jgi:hypothetical protein